MKKILIFILCFCSLIGCFAISAFADANEGYLSSGETITFKDTISGLGSDYSSYIGELYFSSNGIEFFEFAISEDSNGRVTLYYGSINVYDSNNGGWVDDSYRTITSSESQIIFYEVRSFILINEQPNSLYDNVFNIVKGVIFGHRSLTNFESTVLVLISTCLTTLVVALPVVVIYMLLKFFVGTIARY